MIDFHSHILPRMDDGSKSSKESIKMLRSMAEQGVETVVATPHFYANDESLERFLSRRRRSYERLMELRTDDMPKVITGAEVKFYPGIGNMQGLRELCISGTNILLLEMPFMKWTEYTVKEIVDISCSGDITVALAHVDRYFGYQNNAVWYHLAENDILMQANAESFKCFMTRGKVMRMLRSGMVQMLGSDCHNMKDRAPNINVAADCIKKKLGEGFLENLVGFGESLLK